MREMNMTGIKEDLETSTRRRMTTIKLYMIIVSVVEVTLGTWPQNQAKEQGAGTGAQTEEEKGKYLEQEHSRLIISETDNTTKEAENDGELRIEGTEYDEFVAELNTGQSKNKDMQDAENETKENLNETTTLYDYKKVATQEEEKPKEMPAER